MYYTKQLWQSWELVMFLLRMIISVVRSTVVRSSLSFMEAAGLRGAQSEVLLMNRLLWRLTFEELLYGKVMLCWRLED